MGDSMKKVKAGDPLVISAPTFNSFIDAAEDYKRRSQAGGAGSPRDSGRTILIKNASGSACERFGVLAISEPLFAPTGSLPAFKNQVALVGVAPATGCEGAFAVLQEPVAAGKLGRCMVAGVTPVQVSVSDEDHLYAEVADGEAGYLASAPVGSVRILWKESGTGMKWAVVRLGSSAGGHALFGTPTAAFSSGSTITLNPVDEEGTDNGRPDITVHLACDGSTVYANLTTSDILRYIPYRTTQGAADGVLVGWPQMASVTPITAIQFSTSTHKLQVRTTPCKVIVAGTQSDWTDVFTATAFACPE